MHNERLEIRKALSVAVNKVRISNDSNKAFGILDLYACYLLRLLQGFNRSSRIYIFKKNFLHAVNIGLNLPKINKKRKDSAYTQIYQYNNLIVSFHKKKVLKNDFITNKY